MTGGIIYMSGMQKTSREYSLMTSQMLTYGASERHARTSPLQAGEEVLRETSQSLCRKSSGSCGADGKKIGQDISYTRTSEGCCQALEAETLDEYSGKWTNAGMMQSGRFSILQPTFRNIEREYTLSDILETDASPKYFLSLSKIEKIALSRSDG